MKGGKGEAVSYRDAVTEMFKNCDGKLHILVFLSRRVPKELLVLKGLEVNLVQLVDLERKARQEVLVFEVQKEKRDLEAFKDHQDLLGYRDYQDQPEAKESKATLGRRDPQDYLVEWVKLDLRVLKVVKVFLVVWDWRDRKDPRVKVVNLALQALSERMEIEEIGVLQDQKEKKVSLEQEGHPG